MMGKQCLVFGLLCLLLRTSSACAPGELEYWLTDPWEYMENTNAGLNGGCIQPSGDQQTGTLIETMTDQRYQQISGFGAALSNSAASLIWNSRNRDELIQTLFSQSNGIGINYIRLPFDGSDFMADGQAYAYCDDGDTSLNSFSIDRDQEFVIPTIRAILDVNPSVKIMASPWSAPGWMKDTGVMNGGNFLPEYTETRAEYIYRFLQAYRDQGIEIDALTLQNEPYFSTDGYPTMFLNEYDEANLVRAVGGKIAAGGLSTKILIWDHNWDNTNYATTVLNDGDANQYVSGVAWHCYGGDYHAPQGVYDAFRKDVYFTECSGTTDDQQWPRVFRWNMHNLFIGQTRVMAKTVLLWNLVLDENNGPTYAGGGCKTCRGVLTRWADDTGFKKEIEYFVIGHFTKSVQRDATRIGSTTDTGANGNLETVAFENPDGSIVVVLGNNDYETTQEATVRINGQLYNIFGIPKEGAITVKTA